MARKKRRAPITIDAIPQSLKTSDGPERNTSPAVPERAGPTFGALTADTTNGLKMLILIGLALFAFFMYGEDE